MAVQLPQGPLVSVDTRVPNRLVSGALASRQLPEFSAYQTVQSEVPLEDSRIDFLLDGPLPEYLEVKSCTLVEGTVALFPDAPTLRGRRHLETLRRAVMEGSRASVLFVIQRPDARTFRPRDETDPDFGDALRQAASAGVRVIAYRCQVSPTEIRLDRPVSVNLDSFSAGERPLAPGTRASEGGG